MRTVGARVLDAIAKLGTIVSAHLYYARNSCCNVMPCHTTTEARALHEEEIQASIGFGTRCTKYACNLQFIVWSLTSTFLFIDHFLYQ